MEASAQDYANLLKSIDPTWKIRLLSRKSFKTHGVLFCLSKSLPRDSRTGALIEKLTPQERRSLEQKKISYITLEGRKDRQNKASFSTVVLRIPGRR